MLPFWNVNQVLSISKKRWPSSLMYFPNYKLQNTWLDKCLKSPVSEHRWTVNMLHGPKQCCNMHGTTFIGFSHQSERIRVRKSVPNTAEFCTAPLFSFFLTILKEIQFENVSFSDISILSAVYCFLLYWQSILKILFVIGRIYSNQFKCFYLRNKKLFLNFLHYLWYLHKNFNIFKKRMSLRAFVFSRLRTSKDVVRKTSKKPSFRATFVSQHAKGS